MAKKPDEVGDFLGAYPPGVRELALSLRSTILTVLPGASEILDRSARVVGYGFGPGYKDTICTMILSKTGVKLGIVEGAELPDSRGLLEGSGKRHRYVQFSEPSDLRRAGVKSLIKAARVAWQARRAE